MLAFKVTSYTLENEGTELGVSCVSQALRASH